MDEADLILIDQMRTPAIISGPAAQSEPGHEAAAEIARGLQSGQHYTADRAAMAASLTDDGIAAIESQLGIDNLYDGTQAGLAHLIENAVKARALYERDRDYLVSGDQIVLIDRVSGRPLSSRYADGMHEALEAKEGLPVQPTTQVLGSVVCRDYLRQYDRLAGMTGTAASEAPVYRQLYGLEVITIPTNRPVIRVDHLDKLYRTRQAKLAAIAADTGQRAASGQPVLVGAMSDDDAEAVEQLLSGAGIPCELLSARNFEREASILAEAGRPGAVTIVVKMAGRGVDIVLGGSLGADREAVADRGGLCVLGTERNGDRRTELHLRGRAGRQGDPGESLFYVSAEDAIVAKALTVAYRLPGTRRGLGLVVQRIDYSRLEAEVITPDMTGGQLRAGWRAVPALHRAAVLVLAPMVGTTFWLVGTRRMLARYAAVEDLPDAGDVMLRDSAPALAELLLDQRDALLAAALDEVLAQRPEQAVDVAVVYGAGHMPAVTRYLLARYGFRPREAEWLTVFDF